MAKDILADITKSVKEVGDTVKNELVAVKDRLATTEKELDEAKKTLKRIAETPITSAGKVFAIAKDDGEEGRWGFKNVGHFAHEVIQSCKTKRTSDMIQKAYSQEHVIKAAQGMGELIGSDGGFLVPPTFSNAIFERLYAQEEMLGKTDKYTCTGNSMVFPRNAESSRATGSRYGGVQSYWRQEGSQGTKSKPTFGTFTLTLHKLFCLAAITDEMISDSGTALEQYVNRVFLEEIKFVVGDSIINGTGAGQPTGITNAACTVSVAKESGQAAATILPKNIAKMWSRLWAPCRTNAVWYINQDIEPELNTMVLPTGIGGTVVYMPPGGLSGTPYGTIYGRPVVPTEWNATLGTVGDIILADLKHYVTISKGGPQAASSMHFWFDLDEQAIKVTFRLDGQPWWGSALTPYKGGSNTQSCFVTLATRS